MLLNYQMPRTSYEPLGIDLPENDEGAENCWSGKGRKMTRRAQHAAVNAIVTPTSSAATEFDTIVVANAIVHLLIWLQAINLLVIKWTKRLQQKR